jgi:nucleoside 2-deoxyribosyltransferase
VIKPALYLAAPLFSHSERTFNVEIAEILSGRFDVFLPQRDNHLIVDLIADDMSVDEARDVVFRGDVAAIRACDIFFIVLDGRAVDEGACFELGLAFALGKRTVGLQTDPRRLLPIGNNPMLHCALGETLQSVDRLREWTERER